MNNKIVLCLKTSFNRSMDDINPLDVTGAKVPEINQ